ncbi:phosphoribosylaminoimidazolesuccinocarboxamide synthase [Dehalococcoides mccartyi]|jgi:phosphoribosylaminoimidazole-succinocarboxamide synthase|uniref:Phosphoribosylaminoimidazole-succinocarboxamide synthase n=1 Tax=Dehalococcoides mccartyi TaxID=61435 RepID=A0A142V9P6_9CHLR|nr:phosphoribosylaminoimidazolesuccinocarboxamide synthase [Dehalococcoides mccartyi]AII60931.1 phosphoribosylaminoimidazole-succinocarboxamide synthase [Dehalococcoides mccartyi CG5]AMU86554.1 phosphoribosylaminoimidazole-succinocarboxamide synthase [Dehalococcoides mccartyi]AOV99377.1 phosphoribosylaminoimidazole-succinocarboxamide synthase [Dehalococcoides mccartyi]MBA2085165.1 Phosphoribosylaminoimidazole-succinocarboxamide synthase [Dehalococcoides mccartyi]QBX63882.1 phosphoribosylaminoi
MTDIKVLMETALPLPSFIKGKVRDTYLLGDKLLIVASDRISAFDVILPSGISGKGRVLNRISSFWFEKTAHIIPNHVIELVENTSCLDKYLTSAERFKYPEYLIGRSMVVKKVNRVSVECVVRGYIAGSAWSEYKKLGTVNGVSMPKGLQQSQELPKPIFTPTTKGDGEHDRPMSIAELEGMVGKDLADKLARKSLELYKFGREYARNRGIIIADTKFEFGLDGTELILIDEALTPDSSRFWDEKTYKVGEAQDSYDKQPVRDYLETISWNKEPPGPVLPDEVIKSTTRRYEYAYERITGLKLG